MVCSKFCGVFLKNYLLCSEIWESQEDYHSLMVRSKWLASAVTSPGAGQALRSASIAGFYCVRVGLEPLLYHLPQHCATWVGYCSCQMRLSSLAAGAFELH